MRVVEIGAFYHQAARLLDNVPETGSLIFMSLNHTAVVAREKQISLLLTPF